MLKATSNKGRIELNIEGDLPELCADVLTIINSIYNELGLLDACLFRMVIKDNIEDAFIEDNKDIREMED